MEQMDKRRDEEAKLQTTAEVMIEIKKSQTSVLNMRQKVFRRQNIVQGKTAETDDKSDHSQEIGKQVARDFGEAGVFRGEVVRVDYDRGGRRAWVEE